MRASSAGHVSGTVLLEQLPSKLVLVALRQSSTLSLGERAPAAVPCLQTVHRATQAAVNYIQSLKSSSLARSACLPTGRLEPAGCAEKYVLFSFNFNEFSRLYDRENHFSRSLLRATYPATIHFRSLFELALGFRQRKVA